MSFATNGPRSSCMYEVCHRKILLWKLLLADENVIEFCKENILKECVYTAADAWNDIKRVTSVSNMKNRCLSCKFFRAWRKMKGISNDKQDVEERFPNDGKILKIVWDPRFLGVWREGN